MHTAKATDRRAGQRGTGRFLRPFFVLGLAVGLFGCAASKPARAVPPSVEPSPVEAAPADAGRSGRLRPPATLACDRNHLTSYTGAVSGYRREADQTWLEISTDEDTVEAVTVEHAGQPDASAHYLLHGKAFTGNDWTAIEATKGKLVDDMRATAWVCDDGVTAPVIDWQPPGE